MQKRGLFAGRPFRRWQRWCVIVAACSLLAWVLTGWLSVQANWAGTTDIYTFRLWLGAVEISRISRAERKSEAELMIMHLRTLTAGRERMIQRGVGADELEQSIDWLNWEIEAAGGYAREPVLIHRVQPLADPLFGSFYWTTAFGQDWGGTTLTIPLWMPAVALLIPVALKLSRQTPGVPCAACGYDLTGNVSGRCPECGAECSSTTESHKDRDESR